MEENIKVMKMNELKAQIRFLTNHNHFRYLSSDDQCVLVAQPLMHRERRHRGNLSKPLKQSAVSLEEVQFGDEITDSHVLTSPFFFSEIPRECGQDFLLPPSLTSISLTESSESRWMSHPEINLACFLMLCPQMNMNFLEKHLNDASGLAAALQRPLCTQLHSDSLFILFVDNIL